MGARAVLRRALHLCRDVSGAGAVEFAVIAPVLLLLLLGGSELGVGLTVDRKVKAAAGAASDLASQSTTLQDADFRKLMGIVRGALAPYSTAPLKMRLTQIAIDKKGVSTVDWSCATTGYEKLAKGTPVTIPPEFQPMTKSLLAALLTGSGSTIYIIRGEAQYQFQPVTGAVFGKAVTLSGLTFVQPRYSDQTVSDTDGCTTFSMN